MKKIYLFTIIFLGCLSPAFSQNNQSSQNSDRRALQPLAPQSIEINSKTYDAEKDDTASKAVFKADFLNELGTINLIDAFARIPSISMIDGTPQLRGLKGATQILIDGQRMPNGFSLNNLDTKMIDRIEIYRLATAEFSSQAMAGTINIILKTGVIRSEIAANYNLSNKISPIHNAQLSWNSKEGFFSQSTRLSINSGRSEFDSGVQNIDEIRRNANSDPIQITKGTSNSYSNIKSINLSPRLTWRHNSDDLITINTNIGHRKNARIQKDDFQTLLGQPYLVGHVNQMTQTNSSNVNSALRVNRRIDLYSKFEFEFSVNGNETRSILNSNDSDEEKRYQISRLIQTKTSEYGYLASNKYRSTINDSHEFVAGLNVNSALKTDHRVFHQFDPRPSLSFVLDDYTKVKITNLSAFSQDEWQINKLDSLYAGLRWEGISTASRELSSMSNYRSSVWSPILQSLMKLENKQDQVRFGIARTYKAPADFMVLTPKENNRNNSEINPNFQGNPNLKPSLAWNLETAFEHNEEDFNYAIRAYFKNITDVHVQSTALINGEWVSHYINGGEAHTKGIELEIRSTAKRFITEAPKINFRANLARRWSSISSIKGSNNRLEKFPTTLNLGIDYSAKSMPLKFGSTLRLAKGGWQDIETNKRELVRPVISSDLFSSWQFNDKTFIRLGFAKYLTNRFEYQSEVLGTDFTTTRKTNNQTYATWSLMLEHQL